MIKKNLKSIIATSLITLSPVLIGLIMWNKLPDQIATHFDINGNADGYSSKAFAVFGLPFILLAFHSICILATKADPKHSNITDKNFTLVLWIIPVLSVVLNTLSFAYSVNSSIPVTTVLIIFMGVLFIVIGNLMPKVKQNFSLGIKLPWTLADENNWYKTHRLAGKLWVVGGVIICLTAILESFVICIVITTIMAIVPVVYSYAIRDKK